jgi:hemerythrin
MNGVQAEAKLVNTNPTVEDIASVGKFIDFLEDYINSHFNFEEQCMACHRCSVHDQNKSAHEKFRQLFHRFKEKSRKEGYRMELLVDLNQSINAWIQDHILRIDTQLKPLAGKAA